MGVLAGQHALIQEAVDVPFQRSSAPLLIHRFMNIEVQGYTGIYTHNQAVVRPGQFSTQCVEFLFLRPSEVELAKIPKIGVGKSLPKISGQLL